MANLIWIERGSKTWLLRDSWGQRILASIGMKQPRKDKPARFHWIVANGGDGFEASLEAAKAKAVEDTGKLKQGVTDAR